MARHGLSRNSTFSRTRVFLGKRREERKGRKRKKNQSTTHVLFASYTYFTTTRTMFPEHKGENSYENRERTAFPPLSFRKTPVNPGEKIFIMVFKFRGQSPSYTVLRRRHGRNPPRIRMKMYGKPATPGKS